MTKEELEKEAEEWVKNNNYPYSNCPNIEKKLKQAYLAGAEPREKRIAELENDLTWERDTKAELGGFLGKVNDRIAELEAQIEKMKCCKNCLHHGECDLSGYEECKNFDKWEIKENE